MAQAIDYFPSDGSDLDTTAAELFEQVGDVAGTGDLVLRLLGPAALDFDDSVAAEESEIDYESLLCRIRGRQSREQMTIACAHAAARFAARRLAAGTRSDPAYLRRLALAIAMPREEFLACIDLPLDDLAAEFVVTPAAAEERLLQLR